MYDVYIGKLLLPVTPQKIELSIANKNRTITLIDDGEVNILNNPGLTEIRLTAMLPQVKYPFARYDGGSFRAASVYLEYFEQLKMQKAPFRFIVSRWLPGGKRLFDTNMAVSLEEYSISEDARNGFDLEVDIRLKQYRAYGTKTIEIDTQIPTAPVVMEETREIIVNPEPSGSGGGSKKTSPKKQSAVEVLGVVAGAAAGAALKEKAGSVAATVTAQIVKVANAIGRPLSAAAQAAGTATSVSSALKAATSAVAQLFPKH